MLAKQIYHGYFHELMEKQVDIQQLIQQEKMKALKDFNKKRTEFDEMIKKSIKFKTTKFDYEDLKKPTEIDKRVKSVKDRQLKSQKELYELGKNYMISSKKYLKKPLEPLDSHRKISMPQIPIVDRKASTSPPRINYLPHLRDMLNERGKKTHIDDLLEKSMPDTDKYHLVKANIEKFENQAKIIENKVKHGKDKTQIEADKKNLDEFYLSSLKAKIAILNGFQSL
jgi:hypothetical protein